MREAEALHIQSPELTCHLVRFLSMVSCVKQSKRRDVIYSSPAGGRLMNERRLMDELARTPLCFARRQFPAAKPHLCVPPAFPVDTIPRWQGGEMQDGVGDHCWFEDRALSFKLQASRLRIS